MKDDRRKLDRWGGFREDIRYSNTTLESTAAVSSFLVDLASPLCWLLPCNIDTL